MKTKMSRLGQGLYLFIIIIIIFLIGLAVIVRGEGESATFLPLVQNSGEAEGTTTPTVTATADPNLTPTPTDTPTEPFLMLLPDCDDPPAASFNVIGGNWPNETVYLYWHVPDIGDTFIQSLTPVSGAFSVSWARTVITGTSYLVKAASASYPHPDQVISQPFTVPCPPTPPPIDLQIVGPPAMISTPPIVAYQPVQFSVIISNASNTDVSQIFFVDVFIDPGIPIPPGTISIPLDLSDGFTAVSNLAGQTSRVVTITTPLGFANIPEDHLVYAMIPGYISTPLPVINVTPANTPTPPPTPGDGDTISGIVYVRITNWVPAYRALVRVVDSSTGPIASTYTDNNGFYHFANLPPGNYSVTACYELDGSYFFGSRAGVTPPDPFITIFMLQGNCS